MHLYPIGRYSHVNYRFTRMPPWCYRGDVLLYDHARQPVGGHTFKDQSSHVIEAPTLRGLVTAIKQYRKNNGYPSGNPEAEVELAYMKSHPWMVSKEGEKPSIPPPDPLNRWIDSLWRKPPKNLRDDLISSARLEVCMKCPHHRTDLSATTEDTRRLIILSGDRFIPHAGYCTKLHYACGMAVLTDPMPDDPPDGCWVLNGA